MNKQVYYKCISLKEFDVSGWRNNFTIGEKYKLIEKDMDDDTLLLISDIDGFDYWVDDKCFELIID